MGSLELSKIQFQDDIAEVLKKYLGLSIISHKGEIIISGTIDLIDFKGELRDTYSIEIRPSSAYPYRFPHLIETGGRIPKNIDWHIYEGTGHCCICVEPEELIICKNGITLLSFIDLQVIPFLFNQTFRRVNGYFINERSHGFLGTIEFYMEKLSVSNIYKLVDMLLFISKGEEPERVSLCFCSSGQKYRKCHRNSYRLLKEIDRSHLQNDISKIKELLK